MKNIITFLAAVLITATSTTAQVKNPKTETVKVWGNCEMCKATIEKAANKKGDAKAVWNDETKQATITYNTKTTNLNAVLKELH